MGEEIENFILEILTDYRRIKYDELVTIVMENYCANYPTIQESIYWLYCLGKIELHKPENYVPYYANFGDVTIKDHIRREVICAKV